MKDVYDREIEYLTEFPHRIKQHWTTADALFQFVNHIQGECRGGCLTQIKQGGGDRADGLEGWDEELTDEIQDDERIPNHGDRITVEMLPAFAEWARRIDSRYSRVIEEQGKWERSLTLPSDIVGVE